MSDLVNSIVQGFEDFTERGAELLAGTPRRQPFVPYSGHADPEYGPPQSADPNLSPPAAPAPALQNYQEAFTHPIAKGLAADQVTILNDGFQRRDIADASARAGQNFVNNLDQFKTGLAGFVQSDPTMVHTALDLVPPTIAGLVGTLPGGIENADEHHAAVTQHIQHEIAAAAVTSAAEHHEGMARGMLANERISNILGDSTGPLDTYISVQAAARMKDHQAQVQQLQEESGKAVDHAMGNYAFAMMAHPDGGVRFPGGWNQAVMADPSMPPAAKVAMAQVYNNLQRTGDASASDPHMVSSIVAGVASGAAPNVPAILNEAGSGLKLADALMLTRMAPRDATLLQGALEHGRSVLARPENGVAGQEAYARFANWLLPQARNGAVLDPTNKDYILPPLRLNQFAPTTVAYRTSSMAVAGVRPSLAEVFSNPEYRTPRTREPSAVRPPAGYELDGGGNVVPTPVPSHPNTAPFYGVSPLTNDQSINPAGTDRDATGKLLTEVSTDAGIKALGAADLARSTSAPRPVAKPELTEEQQQAIQESKPSPVGRPPAASATGRNANARQPARFNRPGRGRR